MSNFNWHNIRIIDKSQNDGFEELVCQLAKKEFCTGNAIYERYGQPDGGVECVIRLENGSEYGFQAKFFTKALEDAQFNDITKSIKTALNSYPKLVKYYIAIAVDLPNGKVEGRKSCLEKWNDYVLRWDNLAKAKGLNIKFIKWDSSELISLLLKKENEDLLYFFFNKDIFTDKWIKEKNQLTIADLGSRYTPENNIDLDLYYYFDAVFRNEDFERRINKSLSELHNRITAIKDSVYPPNVNLVTAIEETIVEFSSLPFSGIAEVEGKIRNRLNSTNSIDVIDNNDPEKNKLQAIKQQLNTLFSDNYFSLAMKPFLLIYGDGGIGKSHLLGEMVSKHLEKSDISLFFLGQYFTNSETPWNQILSRLQLKCNTDEFLGSLNAKALQSKKHIIIVIDALNEAFVQNFWKDNISSFIKCIKKYKYLGIIISIRTEYMPYIFPDTNKLDILKIRHPGFRFSLGKVLPFFFKKYNIKTSINDFRLSNECSSPLFLKILCETYQGREIPEGVINENNIFLNYFSFINIKISEKYHLPSNLNLVEPYLLKLAVYFINNELNYIQYNDAYKLSKNIVSEYFLSFNLLQELISESILRKTVDYRITKSEELITFAYEKFGNFCLAKTLIEQKENIRKHINYLLLNKTLSPLVFYLYNEKYKNELFFQFNKYQQKLFIKEFVLSFNYRENCIITEKLGRKFGHFLQSPENLSFLFTEVLNTTVSGKNSPFISLLHKNMKFLTMTKRDNIFIPYFYDSYYDESTLASLIDFILDNDFIWIDERIKQTSIILTWTLLSTNRKLRDTATKALIKLLQDKIDLLLTLLKMFKGVNDPYIYERLYAVVYGCVLRTENNEYLSDIGLYVYNDVFNTSKEVYPHILLRDYARNAIEFILQKNILIKEIDVSRVRPPYKSRFPIFLPSNRFIDLITDKYDFIKSSMTTEYGRGTGWYGDFGRYVFQAALENWNVNYDKLSNWCIWKIYTKYKYGKCFFEFDKRIGSGRARGTYPNERIGKKYQWLMFYEALARTSDNKKRAEKYSDILEKYNGPWMPYVRDIDPSMLIRNTYDYDKYSEKFWWKKVPYSNWDIPNWEKSRFDLPELIPIIEQKDSNLIDWILLDADLFWEENKSNIYNSKSIWYRIKAYFMKNENFETARNYLCSQNFYNDRLMNTRQLYQVFSREYFWSAAYKDFNSSYYEHQEYDNFITPDSKDLGIYYPSCDDFLWEEEYDSSKEEAISFKYPSSFLFNKMKMKYSKNEGEFLSQENELLCFDPSVNNNMKSALFIRQKDLYVFLKDNNYSLFFTVIGEKHSKNHIENLSGFYYLNNGKIIGNIK